MEESYKEDEYYYLEYLMDYYQNPRNHGTIDNPTISYEEGNPSCGDVIRLDLIMKNGKIEDIKFSGKGCVISQASASILTEMIKGKTVEEVKKIGIEIATEQCADLLEHDVRFFHFYTLNQSDAVLQIVKNLNLHNRKPVGSENTSLSESS